MVLYEPTTDVQRVRVEEEYAELCHPDADGELRGGPQRHLTALFRPLCEFFKFSFLTTETCHDLNRSEGLFSDSAELLDDGQFLH